jgi:imidazolonepropionase-like amidohydrolase
MAELAVLRGVFTQARLDSKKPPHAINSKTKVLLRALRRELPVRVNCHNAQDIRSAISFAKAFDLKLIIEGASEAYRALDAIQGSSTPVVLSGVMPPGRRDPRDYTRDLAFGRIHPANAAIVAKAGVPLAISAPSNETAGDLLFVAGHAITYGLSPEQALRAVTIAPAEILGVADRVGSIEKGKDADLVILTGPPFDIQSVVDRTIVDGQTAYARPSGGPQPAREQPTLAVRAGRVFAGRQGVIRNGLILVKDSKITYVGPPKNVPPGTAVLHAGDGVVIPGMIDIHSHLGLHLDSEPARLDPGPATTGPRSDRLNLASIVQAIAPGDEAFREALCCGVTCVLLAPETAPPASGGAVRTFRGRMLRMEPAPQTAPMVSGNAALIKTAGDSMADVVVKEYAAVKFSMLGEGQRPARIWEARSLLKRAKEYAEKWEQYDRQHREFQRRLSTTPAADVKEPDRPDRDVAMELLRGLFQRKMPAMVHANRADEILSTLQVFRDEYNLDLIILGGDDSFRVIQDLKKYRVPVAIGPDILRYEKGKPINNADILVKNGLRVAFHTSATSGTQYLPANAAYAVRYGMDRYEALRAITTRPAELLNVDDRVGSIDVGKDADLVILSGEPFEFASRVEKVIVNGRVAFDSQ